MVFGEKLLVAAVPPFDFELSALIFSNGDEQIRRYEEARFWQVIRVDNKLGLVCVKSVGTVEEPSLTVELKTNCKLADEDKKNAEQTVRSLFNLDFDVTSFYKEARNDNIMTQLTKKLFGLKSPTTQFAFEALVDSIVEQQISLKVANVFEKRIIKKWGDVLDLNGEIYFAYPTPTQLSKASQRGLRAVGLSERKAEYVWNVASLITKGGLDLESFKWSRHVEDILVELDKIRGVGVWTAELTMLRGLQRFEALPADDLGLRRTISHYYCGGNSITSFEAREIAERWGKWKGLAAYYLIVAEMLGIGLE